MKTRILLALPVTLLMSLSSVAVMAVSPTAAEIAQSHGWAAAAFEAQQDAKPFFSFTYGGEPSVELLKTWELKRASRPLDAQRTEHTLTYTDPKTGLVVRCVGIEYRDFPTVEWTLYFKNTGDKDTPILADYQPLQTALTPGIEKRITTSGGRSSYSDWPYFNLQKSGDEGMIVVVGWPGQWAAKFTRDKENHLRIQAGQELTHFKLLPGEEVRSPLVVFQFWKGDRVRSQNIWRQWMLAHNLPRPGGKLPPVEFAACSSHQFAEMCNADTKSQILFVDRYLEEGLKLDYWWMDAGWYPCDGAGWPKTGTWEVDTHRFPKGLREISDHAHTKDVNTIVWFEPERVAADTWLTKTHPEWILGGKDGGLLNLGNPDAWKWLVEHIDSLITKQGIDLYRQDFNMDPLGCWRGADTPDRQGITEIKHVTGYLAYWDELRRRHPDMLIDSCASGGKRNDLETLRRSVPLLRSDCIMDSIGNQGHTYGLSSWVPYYGTGTSTIDSYAMRSAMCPHFTACFDMRRKDLNYAEARRLFSSWRNMANCMLHGDYFPLTPYSLDDTAWIAWQFDMAGKGEGVVQAFRREKSSYESIRVKLQGLDPAAVYTVTNVDVDGATDIAGRELMEKGLLIAIKDQPGAIVIVYKKKS
jgi:alpha-galactosidase